ncbi:MAG TPA: ElyC/SanA/YdcF family protein [Desulfobacteria bacterium]|nr:ElyC/SanA/YdcF family protein [Desulfobacteria bacterium]
MQFTKTFRILALIGVAIIAFILYSNLAVEWIGSEEIYSVKDDVSADAALILGARILKNGSPSQVLADRLNTGIELYKSGKVKKLLMTGDHGQVTYDEVNGMRHYAIDRGVPEEDIFMDHAGFSTYDSMYRARDIFMVKKAVIVTQEFHLKRALYIARSLGLDVIGVTADKRKYAGEGYLYFRELFARTKAVAQLAISMKPKYLGPAIPISGDGRATNDKGI